VVYNIMITIKQTNLTW